MRREEDRDDPRRVLLVFGIGRVGSNCSRPPLAALVAFELADIGVEGIRTVLDCHFRRVGLQIVVPDRIGRR